MTMTSNRAAVDPQSGGAQLAIPDRWALISIAMRYCQAPGPQAELMHQPGSTSRVIYPQAIQDMLKEEGKTGSDLVVPSLLLTIFGLQPSRCSSCRKS